MSRLSKSDLTERKALILARFTLADAIVFCGLERRGRSGVYDMCPSCQMSGLNFIISGAAMFAPRLTDARELAHQAVCSHCNFRGDAAAFVAAARGIRDLNLALDAIEIWLDAQCRLFAGGAPCLPRSEPPRSKPPRSEPTLYFSPLSQPLRTVANAPCKKRRVEIPANPLNDRLAGRDKPAPRQRRKGTLTLFKSKGGKR